MADTPQFQATKFAAARLKAAQQQPFLGVALFALSPCNAPGLGTFAVDERWRVFIDPGCLDEWSIDEVAGVLLHEVSHVVRFHADRARASFVDDSTHLMWNVAGDAEINDDLIADGVVLPGKPVTPRLLSAPRGKAAEFYYARLLANNPPRLPEVNCGAGAHGVPERRMPVGLLPPGVAPDEAQLLRRQVALAVRAGMTAGTGRGGWPRWAESFLEPVVDWRRLLAGAIRGSLNAVVAGRSDYLYSRPSRRQIPGVVLPAIVRPIPTVAAIIDTSASVGDVALASAWTEVLGMMRSVGVRRDRVRVWSADTVAHRLKVGAGRRAELIGGGGTDMAEAIAVALRERPMADVVVVLTDGETPWPGQRPKRPVIVGLFCKEDSYAVAHVPDWATTVRIPVSAL